MVYCKAKEVFCFSCLGFGKSCEHLNFFYVENLHVGLHCTVLCVVHTTYIHVPGVPRVAVILLHVHVLRSPIDGHRYGSVRSR